MPANSGWTSAGRGLSSRDITAGALLAAGLGLLVVALALALDMSAAERAARATGFVLLSLPPLLLALPSWLHAARGIAGGRTARWFFGAGLVAALVPERLVRGDAVDLVAPLLYVAAALLLTADRERGSAARWRDLIVVAALWLPLELGRSIGIQGDFVLLRLLGLNVLFLLFVIERPVWEPGRLVPSCRRELLWGLGAWAGFVALAIPISMASGFAMPGISDRSTGGWSLLMISTFWIVALPEEALFRGVIQKQLERAFGRLWPALLIASVLFGLSHLNNAAGWSWAHLLTPSVWGWPYVGLATLAGVAYGLAYHRTGNIAAPTLTHFLVDVTWRGFFAG